MTEATTLPPPASPSEAAPESGDERLAHRGPIQTLLTRPEIGALLGAAGVWLLFWMVSAPFGTVGGTANFLDVTAVLGLMAVPVALLMIGGEFDLSSGSMTGATAVIVILLSSDTGTLGGAGLSLHIAVPLSLAFALAIGWFNGTMVEKTSLPSFIVTLGTFFILIGAKLGFAKLFTNKVIVEGLDEAQAYDFWHDIFGAQWVRNGHIWDGRDWAWAGLLVFGAVALILGVLELTYRRRADSQPAAVVAGVAGAVAAVGGWIVLLTVGGSASDWGGSALVGAGVLVAVAGWCKARYEPAATRSSSGDDHAWIRFAGAGVIGVVAALVIAWVMDSTNADQLNFLPGASGRTVFALGLGATGVLAVLAALGRVGGLWPGVASVVTLLPALSFMMTVQAARAILFALFALLGLLLITIAGNRARIALGFSAVTAASVVMLAFFMQSQADSRKIRVELFAVLLLAALVLAVNALARHLSARRSSASAAPEMGAWTRAAAVAGLVTLPIFAILELVDGDGILYSLASGAAKGAIVAFGVYAVGTVARLLFTRDDGIGRSAVAVGLVCVLLGVASKLLFITEVEAAATRAQTRFGVNVLFFLILALVAAWVLVRTQFGSWIFAVGGNKDAARSVGVPAARTKTTLFMLVSGAAWLTGMTIAFRLNSVQANVGDGNEFRYIIVAVVGGNLLTGGYGSALGAAIGALIWGMISQGIGFSGWNSDWRFLVLGALLLVAVLVNNYVRGLAAKAR